MNIQFILLLTALLLLSCGSGGGGSGGVTASIPLPQIDIGAAPIGQSDSSENDANSGTPTTPTDFPQPPDPVDPQPPIDPEYAELAVFRMNPPAAGDFLFDAQGEIPLLPKYYPMDYRPEGCYLRLFGDQPQNYHIDLGAKVSAPLPSVLIEATLSFFSQPERENQRRPIFSSLGNYTTQWEWGLIRKGNVQKAYFRIRQNGSSWSEVMSAPLLHIRTGQETEFDQIVKVGFSWSYGKVCFYSGGISTECVLPFAKESQELLDVSHLALGWNEKDVFEGDLLELSIYTQVSK